MKSSIKRVYRNRKGARPFSSKESLHIVMRSEIAEGDLSLLRNGHRQWLRDYLPKTARKFSIRLYASSNNGNHLHLVVRTKERDNLSKFLRVLIGVIARRVLDAQRGRSKRLRFWAARPYSRVVTWGREFWGVLRYVERNILETARRLRYRKREMAEGPLAGEYLAQRAFLNQRDLRLSG